MKPEAGNLKKAEEPKVMFPQAWLGPVSVRNSGSGFKSPTSVFLRVLCGLCG